MSASAGISQGYATLGQIGFAERMDYTAIGTVTNLAARLCGEAKDGQILVSQRIATAIEDRATREKIGELGLKGLSRPVRGLQCDCRLTRQLGIAGPPCTLWAAARHDA